MRRRRFVSLLCGAWAARSATAAGSGSRTAVLQLAAAATTSAGIFDARGRLIRTLWRGRMLPAGPARMEWDGRDDDGAQVPVGVRYEARLLSHNVRYEWEGVIGNTSSAAPGTQIHRAYGPINDMAIDARGNGFYAVGYNERGRALHRFDPNRPDRQEPLFRDDFRRVFRYAATDGELVYFANIGLVAPPGSPFRGADTFVVAFRVGDGTAHVFPAGKSREGNFQWQSGADYELQQVEGGGVFPNAPSGLAVQRRGNLLLVSHRGANQIRLFHKKDGSLLATVQVDSPGDIDVAPDDSFWVVCRGDGRPAVVRFRNSNGAWRADRQVIEPEIEPVAIGVSPADGTLAVVDAHGEQIRGYDDAGKAIWVLGQPGGYRQGGPEVMDDRFGFSAGPTYVAFEADGSFWIGDPANERNLRFSPQRHRVGQIQYLSHSYVATVDVNRPTRVFRGFLEFEVDYRRPLRQSWQLVRNWSVGLGAQYRRPEFTGLHTVATLADGRCYAVVFRNDADGDELVELAPTGLRPFGQRLRADERLYPDGSLRSHLIRFGGLQIFAKRIAGTAANGAPIWSEPTLLAEVARLAEHDPWYHDVPAIHGINDPSYPTTGSGLLIAFNPGKSTGFHLGALRPGTEGWRWRASPSGVWQLDAMGRVLTRDGTFELGHGVNYPASVAVASGANVVYGYHGEAWNGGEANQWMHFHESGLFIGQFGASPYPTDDPFTAKPGAAGNAFCPTLVTVGGQLYLWHNDENIHCGVHRWQFSGLDSLRIATAPIPEV